MDISLYDENGNMLVEAYGSRLFSWSWVFGPLRYRARLKQNGEIKAELSSESAESTQETTLDADTDTEACGYYAYENAGGGSNEVCVTFRTPPKESRASSASPSPSPATPR